MITILTILYLFGFYPMYLFVNEYLEDLKLRFLKYFLIVLCCLFNPIILVVGFYGSLLISSIVDLCNFIIESSLFLIIKFAYRLYFKNLGYDEKLTQEEYDMRIKGREYDLQRFGLYSFILKPLYKIYFKRIQVYE